MDYTLINLATFLIGLVFLYNGYRLVKSGREDIPVFLLTSAIGLGLIGVALFPDFFWLIADITGIELRSRAMLVVANLTLFTVVIYLLNRIGQLTKRVSRVNEELSLLRTKVEDADDK